MGQEDGLLTQPSKYFSYLLVTNGNYLLQTYLIREGATNRELDIRYPLTVYHLV